MRLNWLRTRIESTFPHVKSDKLTKALEEETNVYVARPPSPLHGTLGTATQPQRN